MKDYIIRKTNSSSSVVFGMLVIVIFMTAMKHPAKQTRKYSYLALGDSYTIGESVEEKDNFPVQVMQILGKEGIGLEKPEIIAKTGWTTDELRAAIQKAGISKSYDFVSLLIGVNNQYRGRTVATYAPEFENLLQQAIHFAGDNPAHVVVLSIPDWGVTPFAKDRNGDEITRQIDEYNDANKKITHKYQVSYIDITPGTREAATDPELLTKDGLHPSAKEYRRWAERVADWIQKKL